MDEWLTILTGDIERATILVAVVVLSAFEFLRPLKKRSFLSRDNLENVFWVFFNFILTRLGLGFIIVWGSDIISRELNPFALNMEGMLGIIPQFLLFLLINDLVSYVTHRFLHTNSFMWGFHKLHHSTRELNTVSSFRHHFFEDAYYAVFGSIVTSFFIVDPNVRLSVFALTSLVCCFQHANIKMTFPNWCNTIFVTPLNHRWHHATEMHRPKGQNFGFVFSFWDKFWGSYYVEEKEPEVLGIKSPYPEHVLLRVLHPFNFFFRPLLRKKD